MEEFLTIIENEAAEITEKKSKFIANLCYIENVEQAEQKIKEIKRKYFDSKHNCIAYRVIEQNQIIERSSDDGEPSGTAGGPMLNILQKYNLCNVLVVVTRYFGGILLGTGGLVRAYTDVTKQVVEKSKQIYKIQGIEAKVELDYATLDIFKHYCKNNNINIIDIEYLEKLIIKIEMEKNRKNIFLKDLETKTLNIYDFQEIGEKYITKTVEKNK